MLTGPLPCQGRLVRSANGLRYIRPQQHPVLRHASGVCLARIALLNGGRVEYRGRLRHFNWHSQSPHSVEVQSVLFQREEADEKFASTSRPKVAVNGLFVKRCSKICTRASPVQGSDAAPPSGGAEGHALLSLEDVKRDAAGM